MAGFQQAANALTGAIGTVGGRIGVYKELVGKNQELIKKTQAQNEELEKKNKELENKNKTIKSQYKDLKEKNEELNLMNSNLITSLKINLKQNELTQNLAKRLYANTRSRASRDKMLDVVYGKKTVTTAGPTVGTKEGGK